MKNAKRVTLLGVCCILPALASTVRGDAVGLVAVDNTSPVAQKQGLKTCNVYVQFDDPADHMVSCFQSDIVTDDPEGFYQHQFGTDLAPSQALCDAFPLVCSDSFVTIGVLAVTGGGNTSAVDPDWDAVLFNNGGAAVGGWFNAAPLTPNNQGTPDENGQVVIAQFTVNQGFNVSGELTVFWWPNGQSCCDGMTFEFGCFASLCPADFNGDGVVDAADLALLLGAWGPNPGHPADFNGDDMVNAADLAQLLGAWGQCD